MLCFYYHSFLLFLLKIGIPNSSVGMMNPMMNSMMFGLGPGGQMPNSLHRSMHELRLGQTPNNQPTTIPRGGGGGGVGGGGPPSPTTSQKSKKSTRSDRFAHRTNNNKQNSRHNQRHTSNSDSRPASRPQSRNNSRTGGAGGHGHSRGPAARHYRGSSRGRRRSISTEDEIDSDEVCTTLFTLSNNSDRLVMCNTESILLYLHYRC